MSVFTLCIAHLSVSRSDMFRLHSSRNKNSKTDRLRLSIATCVRMMRSGERQITSENRALDGCDAFLDWLFSIYSINALNGTSNQWYRE